MLERVIDLSIRHRVVVLLGAGLLVVLGVGAFRDLPLDAFPDTTPVQVAVNATAPALSPEEIEQQITWPVEQAISGLPGLVDVRSLSKFGLSQTTVVFEDATDPWLARQLVSERLQSAKLPEGIERPILGPVTTGLGEVLQYLVTGQGKSLTELRTIHDWVVRPQMLSLAGVAEVNTWGGHERQIHVIADPQRMSNRDVTLDQLWAAIRRNQGSVGGGYGERAGEAIFLQGLARIGSLEHVASIGVGAVDGVAVRVDDVARVIEGHEIRRGAVTANGQGEVVLGLGFMLQGESSLEVTQRLERRLDEVRMRLPPGVEIKPVYSRIPLVHQVLRTVRNNLLEGALLVIAVLFAFLGNLRAGLIVASAIPLSLLFAFDLMGRLGIAGTLMSLGAIDFGLVVDSSLIMVENAERKLAAGDPRSRAEIVREAALEVRGPTLFGELVIAAVYLPVLALEGIEGKMFRPMAATVILALVGSMLLSLTVVPALSTLLLRKREARSRHGWLERGLVRIYSPLLELALRHRALVLGVAGLLVAGAGVLASRLGTEFLPRLQEGSIVVNTVRAAGVSLEESVRYGTQLEKRLLELYPDEIENVWTRTGTAEVATDPMGFEVSDMFLQLRPRERWKKARTQHELVTSMSAELEGMPGMRAVFTQPIEMRMNEVTAGIRSDVGVIVQGDDFEVLRDKARQIQELARSIPGAGEVAVEPFTGAPVLRMNVNRAALARHGIDAAQILAIIESIGGRHAGELREDQRRFDIVVRLDERYRTDVDAMSRLLVAGPHGERIPLGRLADIELVDGPSTIHRQWGKRRIVVQASVRDRDIGSYVAELRRAIDQRVDLPQGTFVRYGGQFEHFETARQRLFVVVPLTLLLVFSLLYLTYGRVLDALRVFTGVPFAAVGGIAALWIRGLPFSISAAVGFIALSGVAVLGDMVLVSRTRQLTAAGISPADAIRDAARGRLRPVLMTALVAGLGFLPMALNTGVGAEVQRPLATVLIGGVITSTIATLIVLPVLYSLVARRNPENP